MGIESSLQAERTRKPKARGFRFRRVFLGFVFFLRGATVAGQSPAPPKKPWNDDSLYIPTNHGFHWIQSARIRPPTVFMGLVSGLPPPPLPRP